MSCIATTHLRSAQYIAGTTTLQTIQATGSLVTSLDGLPLATASITSVATRTAASTVAGQSSGASGAAPPGVATGANAQVKAAAGRNEPLSSGFVEAAGVIMAAAIGAAAVVL
jgi:hypothetical protein